MLFDDDIIEKIIKELNMQDFDKKILIQNAKYAIITMNAQIAIWGYVVTNTETCSPAELIAAHYFKFVGDTNVI